MRIILLFLTIITLTFSGCKEGTITYDIEFPSADSCEAAGNCGSGGGGGGPAPGGPITNTNSNGSGAGVTVSKTITNVYEDGSDNDTFTVVLVKEPTADVFMSIANPDTTEVNVSPTSISFGTGNWSTAQTISLTGVEDGISDGNLSTSLTVGIDNSTDTDYNTGISNITVEVNSIDSSSISAIVLGETGGSTSVTESGATDNITVALSRQPAQTVTVNLSPSDATEFSISPTSVTFGPGNFSVAQNIVLTAIEDSIVDGLQNVNLSTNSTSTDISYNNVSATVAVAVVDSGNAPPAAISNLAASAGTQLNTLTWSKPTGATSYTLYWSTTSPVSTSSGNFTISSGNTLTYTHAGLTAGTRYYYAIVANNSHGTSGLSNEVSDVPTLYSGCTSTGNLADNDPNLILHYGLNNNLEDNKDTYGDSRYDLSNQNGTVKYAQSCAYGQAAYFDSTTGFLQEVDFDDSSNSNLFTSGNFTIAMWFLADADMNEYSSMLSSKKISGAGDDGGAWSFQLDVDKDVNIRWRSAQGGKVIDPHITHTSATGSFVKNQWYYTTFVKHDNGTGQIYIDGVLKATSTGNQHTPMDRLRIAVNRTGGNGWKGYIDEVKIYNRAFDSDDVKNACLLYSYCSTLAPVTPDNLTATAASSSQINLAWTPVNGVTNYTIEWGTSSGSYTGGTINTVNTTYSHTGRSASTAYYYRVRANNSAGSSAYSSEATATTLANPGFTISSTTATVRESGVRGDLLWMKSIGDMTAASGTSGRVDLDRSTIDSEMNVISAGFTEKSTAATNAGAADMLIMKHGPSGQLIWQKQLGSSSSDSISDVAVDSSDNIYVLGMTTEVNGGTFDGVTVSKAGSYATAPLWLLIKFDKDGNRQWIKQIDKTGDSWYGSARAMDIEGSAIYIAGYSKADETNQVEKYDLNGNKQNSINLTQPTHPDLTASPPQQLPWVNDLDATSSGVYVVASRNSIVGKLTKLDSNLSSEVWQVQTSDNFTLAKLRVLSNGNIVTLGHTAQAYGNLRRMSLYNSSGTLLNNSAANQGNSNRKPNFSTDWAALEADSADNIFFYQVDEADRYQRYFVKYDSSLNFVSEKKLPPNFWGKVASIRQNSAGEEFIYLVGSHISAWDHGHAYGEFVNSYMPGQIARISNNSVAPVSSTPGYAAIKIGITTIPTDRIYVCPKYNNAYITTGVVSDELAVHPAGPMNLTVPSNGTAFYRNSCLHLHNFTTNDTYITQQLELYAIQDNVTDANQDITLSFEVITTDTTYQSKTIPNVTVTVENASVSAPTAPVNLKATANGSSQIDLTWQKPYMTGLGEGVQNYSLFWSTDNVSFTQITGITNDNYTHTGLSGSTTYYYRVVPNNQAGSGPASNLATATTDVANSVTITHTNGSTTVNEAGYGQGFYDWSELTSPNSFNAAVTRDTIGNLYVVGYQSGNLASIAKYNSIGTQQWISTVSVGAPTSQQIRDVLVDSSGNSYLIYGDSNIYVSKFNSSGTNQWTNTYTSPGTNNDGPASAEIHNDQIYINGYTNGTWTGQTKTGQYDSIILVLDTDGNQVSASQTGGSSPALMIPSSLAVDSNGNYYQAGHISWTSSTRTLDGQTCSSSSCVFVRKFNSSHSHQWTRLYSWDSSTKGGSIKLNAAENRIYWVNTTSHNSAINGQTNPLEPTSAITVIVNSLLTSDGDFDWTTYLPYHTISIAGNWGQGGLAVDASDNLYALYYQPNPKPAYYGEQGEIQVTKLNSSGVEQWTRTTGGDTPFMGGSVEIAYDIHSSSGGQLYIVGSSNGFNGKFHGDSISTNTGFLFKADGTHSYMGRDSFTITPTGTQPTSTVTFTLTSSDTSEMIPQPDQGTKAIFANSNWNNPISFYVAAVQDNTTDSNSTPNFTITTSSSDAAWDNLTFNVPVTVVNQTQPGPYIGIIAGTTSVTETDSNYQDITVLAYADRVVTSPVTITLSTNSVPADAASSSGTANYDRDYAVIKGNVTISAGSHTGASSAIRQYGDNVDENDETIYINASSITNGVEDGVQTANIRIIDDDTVKLKWSVTGSDYDVNEAGSETRATTLLLDSQPNGNVVIDATVSDSSEFNITSGSQVTFNSSNWFNGQNIVIQAIDDNVDDDNVTVQLQIAVNTSSTTDTTGYASLGTKTKNFVAVDDDTAGMTFRFVGDNATVSETGTISSDIQNTDNLTMKLASEPTGNVVIDLSSSDTGEFTISPSQMTFTTSNWNVNQTMTVTGQADGIEDGTVQVFARAAINTAGTADAKYDALSQDSKAVYVYNVTTLSTPAITAVNAAEQQNQIVWNAYTGATGYKLYYDTNPSVSTSDPYFTVGSSMTAYYHNGLQSGQRVYYRVVATTGSGDSPLSNEMSGLPTSFPGCGGSYTADSDPNLIVHYPFEGNLEDVRDVNTDNRYDMTHVDNGGQALKYAGSCAGGQSLYFDSSTGQAINTQFTDSNVGGQLENDNFTVSFWTVKDGDMVKFSSVVNTGLKAAHAPTGDWSNKSQFDVGTGGNMRWVASSGTIGSSGGMVQNQWYHITGTFEGTTGKLYIDGNYSAQDTTADIGFRALMLGVNRSNDINSRTWKGYLDDLKIYHGAKTQQEIAQLCLSGSTKCNYTPITPTNFAGVGRAGHNVLTWDAGVGVDNYTIRWNTTNGAFSGSPSVSNSDNEITVSGNSTTYMHMDLTGGYYYHYKIRANRTLPDGSVGSSNYSSVVGNVQPTSFVLELVQSYNQGICKFQSNLSLVRCRGKNNYNQFNTANTNDVTSPIAVHGLSNVATFTYDYNKMAFLNHDSSYQHEGYDLGYGTQTTPVSNVTNPIQIVHGNNFVLYLLSNGTIRSRGFNSYGQLGDGTTTNVTTGTTTTQVSGITTATKIAAAQYTGVALLSNGQVWAWGNAADGELGQGNKTTSLSPVQVPLPSNTAIDIFASGRTVGALMSNGTIYAWGDNTGSKIKLTTNTSDVKSPIQLSTRTDLKEADWSSDHVIVRTTDGKIFSGGKIRANSNLTGNATFLASITGSWKYTEGLIEMDDTGFQNRVIDVEATGLNAFWVIDNSSLYCIGYNGESQCTNSTSTGGNQTTPLILEGM